MGGNDADRLWVGNARSLFVFAVESQRLHSSSMPLLIPNFHVALLHFPIALLLLGTAIEVICSIHWKMSPARMAGRWMLLFSVLLGWPAVYSGAYAVRTAAGEDFAYSTWSDMRSNSPALSNAAAWETLRTHIFINGGAMTATSVIVVGFLMAGRQLRIRLHIAGLCVLLLACAAVLVGAWHGGELVYWHDVTHIAASPGIAESKPRGVSLTPTSIVPPLDAHVAMAGFATGAALIAWGVAARSRRAIVAVEPGVDPMLPGTAPASADSPIVDPQRDRIFAAFQQATVEVAAPAPPAALGLLTAVAFAAAAALGMWSLADSFGTGSPTVLLKAILDRDHADGPLSRRLAHLVAGVAIILLALAVGWCGARSRRGRSFPMIVGFVLLLALVAQAWLGVLLLLDSNSGSITHLNG